jgi:predicted AAA+ superfamily ATPase
MRAFNRNLTTAVREGLARFAAVVIVGARQSGKTTLARSLCPDWHYVDLERGSDYDFLTRDYDFFFQQYPGSVIFDEAQRSPELFRELRGVIDGDRGRKGRFLLTGSSSPELQREVAESLAGRVAVFELGTLKMNERYGKELSALYEILNRAPEAEHMEALKQLPVRVSTDQVLHHFLRGGYPEPAEVDEDAFYAMWSAQYQQTYLDRDIRRLFPNLNTDNYRRFLSMLSELSGTIINRSEVGRSLNASESAIRDYLQIAQGTFIWRNLPSLEKTVSKSIVRMPRGYLRDSGLLHHLTRVRSREQLLQRPGTGAAFEGFIIEEIIQGLSAVNPSAWDYRFYRTRAGAEVDLVLTSPSGTRIPVEIKFGTRTHTADLRALHAFIQQENAPYGILINNANEVRLLSEHIIQVPAGCIWPVRRISSA